MAAAWRGCATNRRVASAGGARARELLLNGPIRAGTRRLDVGTRPVRVQHAVMQPKGTAMLTRTPSISTFELRYQSLFDTGRALCFPCDAEGHVLLDELSERALTNYLFARAAVGRDYAHPAVCQSEQLN